MKDFPAFPSSPTVGSNGDLLRPVDIGCQGMSLRDYFAAKALPPIIDRLNGVGLLAEQTGYDFRRYAETAYQLADAMLAARGDV